MADYAYANPPHELALNMRLASVAEWHSKFHAAARGIAATPLKKWMIP
jgi:hypothetical protein